MQAYVPPDYRADPPAVVRPAEDLPPKIILRPTLNAQDATLAGAAFSPKERADVAPAKQETRESRISNRPENVKYRVVYVNGIHTSEADAQRAATLVKTCLGVENCELSLVYNPPENTAKAGLKIAGASISSRLGQKSEPESVSALVGLVRQSLQEPHTRLIVVGHSQGSLIIQNAFDRVYDEHLESADRRALWAKRSPSIEVIMYAPIVRTIAPGPQAVSLLNSLDAPARGIGKLQGAITFSKDYLGYRQHQNIRTIKYNPSSNEFPDLFFDPGRVHESFQLLIDNPDFNFRLLAEDPITGTCEGKLFAKNLAKSILDGKRSDMLHYELIIKGCERFGPNFAVPFMECTTEGSTAEELCLDRFVLSGPRLERLKTTTAK